MRVTVFAFVLLGALLSSVLAMNAYVTSIDTVNPVSNAEFQCFNQ